MDDGDIAAEQAQRWLDAQLAERARQRQRQSTKINSVPNSRQKTRLINKKPASRLSADYSIESSIATKQQTIVECTDCGCQIPEKRLIAIPGAHMCSECATYEEQEQNRQRRLKGYRV